uniref:C2H2-type domain-containing protein n=1 Tax=Pinguiococcus pyrenoidosus TaxID=172671 RepID=A0A7R9YBT7_9STRA
MSDAEDAMRALRDVAADLGHPDDLSGYPELSDELPHEPRTARRVKHEPQVPPPVTAPRKSDRKKAGTKRPRKAEVSAFPCKKCDKVFDKLGRLMRHMETHKTKADRRKYVCSVPGCGKSYLRLDHLKRHQITHKGVKPFVCPGGKAFFYHYHLLRHQRSGCCKAKRRKVDNEARPPLQPDRQLQERTEPRQSIEPLHHNSVVAVPHAPVAAPAAPAPSSGTPSERASLQYADVHDDVGDFLDAPMKDGVSFLYESLLESHRISHN